MLYVRPIGGAWCRSKVEFMMKSKIIVHHTAQRGTLHLITVNSVTL